MKKKYLQKLGPSVITMVERAGIASAKAWVCMLKSNHELLKYHKVRTTWTEYWKFTLIPFKQADWWRMTTKKDKNNLYVNIQTTKHTSFENFSWQYTCNLRSKKKILVPYNNCYFILSDHKYIHAHDPSYPQLDCIIIFFQYNYSINFKDKKILAKLLCMHISFFCMCLHSS